MPLVAVALALSTLLHAGSLALAWTTSSFWSSMSALPPPAPAIRAVFAPDPLTNPSVRWVASHAETSLWSDSGPNADSLGIIHQWEPLQVVGTQEFDRVPVWDPSTRNRGWVRARDVGPVDPALVGSAYLPPIGRPIAWGGPAKVTMYTCVELGGCAATASGVWPEPGMVAVDPSVIPLGSTVWIQGLGTFVATDTGSLIRGAHLDVYGLSYAEAIQWGVQERSVLVYPPS